MFNFFLFLEEYFDPETADKSTFSFDDRTIRRAFIRKVYSILMVQLSISIGFIALFTFHESVKKYVQMNLTLLYIAMGITFVLVIVLSCCEGVRRTYPANLIILFVFTLAESFLLGTLASFANTKIVILAVGITAAVCLALTLFAFQTKWDFTMMGGFLFVALIVLMIFGIITIFMYNEILNVIYSALGALLFSFYLVYDTQLMMGGKHKYALSPEEYVFAALNLYLDIINIFIYILSLLSGSK